ncbi:MAG: gliding motility protein GldL [Flavobacteriaceae bacterium]
MAQSLQMKKVTNMVYGLGASIVILGALFKLLHWHVGPVSGSMLLAIGLITEAGIFAFAAFEPVEEDLDWTMVYPQLAGGSSKKSADSPEGLLSKKLDEMLKEAQLDTETIKSLSESIKNFEGAAKVIAPQTDTVATTNKYNEEMARAAEQMELLNQLYKQQMDSATKQAGANAEMAENSEKLKDQMNALASNLDSLNSVYGGMLSAMNKN